MPEHKRAPAFRQQARSLRLALLGGSISALGLLGSMRSFSLLSLFWLFALAACLLCGWYALRQCLRCPGEATADDAACSTEEDAAPEAIAPPVVETAALQLTPQQASQRMEEGKVLSAAGHDLRQPLQAISLFSATLAAHPLPPESAKLVQGIEQASEALSTLFEAVMALARLAAGKVTMQCQTVSLGPLLKHCVASHIEDAQEKDLHLRHVATRLTVQADEAQLSRAVDCLIEHAMASTREGGILLGCRRDAAWLRIEVWDSGSALDDSAASQVFEPFSAYGQAFGDRGLGLVLAQRLVQAMGGELELGKTTGRGKRFVIRLPRPAA